MTHIEQMIKDMCPNGVEYKKLGEVCELKRGSGITESQAIDGDVPVIAGGQKPAYYHNQSNREGLNITVAGSGAYAGYVAFWEQPIFVSDAFTVSPKDTSLDIKFVYYFLKNIQPQIHNTKKGSGVPHVHPSSISDFEIPIPPLEIQKKIVECLDKFSALAAELQAELQMRRKQYEYYRTQLLTPHSESNSADKSDDCNWVITTLGEICPILRGKRLTKSELSEDEKYPVFHGGIEPLGYYKEHNRDANTVMIINVGASAGTVGYCDQDFWSSDGCFCLGKSDRVIPKFLYYLLQTREPELKSRVRYAGIPTLDGDVIKRLQVSIPSIEEQERVVVILDKFEKLMTSLSDGIPAEQAAQQKRYEYYRDLLLTFPCKEV